MRRVLSFVEPAPEAVAAAIVRHLHEGHQRLLLQPDNALAQAVYVAVAGELAACGGMRVTGDTAADLVVVCETDEPGLAALLLAQVDRDAAVVAVKGSRYWSDQPLFLIAIPKAGTHLLRALVSAFGYAEAGELQDDPAPGHWYFLEYSNAHTVARDFLIDTTRRAPYGNRHHPFMRSPALFIYRNPLDIVTSEADYYHRDGKSPFAGYLSGLDLPQRLHRLIDDRWLLGSIRERVGGFIPWLDFPNVIPVCYEELVGARGGGDTDEQIRTVWSLQLKLQVPGRPDELARTVYDPGSPTFSKGTVHRHRDVFDQEAWRRFDALPQDFMQAFGYDRSDRRLPGRVDEFRRRPLSFSTAIHTAPITIQSAYFGFNIVRLAQGYLAVRQGFTGDLLTADLMALEADGIVARGATAEQARRGAERLGLAT